MDDLAVIAPLVRGRRIVAAGEATHGTREFSRMKHRLFRYLVEEHGFTVLALEASMPNCRDLDAFVVHGTGDAKRAIRAQGSWTLNTQEVLDLVNWMRKWNAENPSRPPVRVVGIEMQDSSSAIEHLQALERSLNSPRDWESAPNPEDRDYSQMRGWATDLSRRLAASGRQHDAEWATLVAEGAIRSLTQDRINRFTEMTSKIISQMPDAEVDAKVLAAELPGLNAAATDALRYLERHSDKVASRDPAMRAELSKKYRACRQALEQAMDANPRHQARLANLVRILLFLDEYLWIPMDTRSYPTEARAEAVATISRAIPGSKVFLFSSNGRVVNREDNWTRSLGLCLRHLEPASTFIGLTFGEGRFGDRLGNLTQIKKADGPTPGSWERQFEKLGFPIAFIPTNGLDGQKTLRGVEAGDGPYSAKWLPPLVNLSTALDAVIHFRLSTPAKSL